MAYILNIETATTVCSVSIQEDEEMLSLKEIQIENSHSSKLASLIKDNLEECKLSLKDMDAVSISMGPGSYTGLRIGVSSAKGLCFGLDIPLIAVNTLKAMASQQINLEGYLCPMIDARRMEVYSSIFNNDLEEIEETKATIIDESSFDNYLSKHTINFFGNGASKCKQIIQHPNARFISNIFPSASTIGPLAYEKFKNNDFEDVAYFEPYYLKDFMTTKPKSKV